MKLFFHIFQLVGFSFFVNSVVGVKIESERDLQGEFEAYDEGVCEDYPPGWHDADGSRYNCQWYSRGRRCARYGDGFGNQGFTANQACCACGGGTEKLVSFIALGDAPYSLNGRYCLNGQLRDLDLSSPNGPLFIAHVGDIKRGWQVCDDEAYNDVAEIFFNETNALKYDPRDCFFIPGDNEWNDCPDRESAWDLWTTHFGLNNPYGFGTFSSGAISVSRQTDATRAPDVDRSENFAFFIDHVLFIGLNMVGGAPVGDEKVRLKQNYEWTRDQLAFYSDSSHDMNAAVMFGHSTVSGYRWSDFGKKFIKLLGDDYPDLPVFYIHGDQHRFRVVKPYPTSAPNFWDLTVDDGWSSPPLMVTLVSYHNDTVEFRIDDRGGLYQTSCPLGDREVTWSIPQ